MKKLLNTAFIYALAAMAGGVFYREFTKFNGFSGRTALGLVHTHLFLLGTVFFLLAALFSKELDWARERNFRLFYGLYNTGLCVYWRFRFPAGWTWQSPASRGWDISAWAQGLWCFSSP